jgi:prepilin-type N-terminal cleavage/methylation domain-containing protein
MRIDHSSRLRRTSHLGFTLLEVMLALLLAGGLLAAVYGAIDQAWRMSASGREEMERAQLARALIRKIEFDVRAITFVPPPPADDTATSNTTTGTSSTSTSSSSGSGGSSRGNSSGSNPSVAAGGSSSGKTSGGAGSSSGGNSSGASKTSPGGTGSSSGSNPSGGGGSSNTAKSASGATSGSASVGGAGSGAGGSGGASGSGAGSASASSDDTTETEPPEPNSKSIGIRGTATQMELNIARPRRDLQSISAGVSPRTSDLRSVTYRFLAAGMSSQGGLVRTEGDRLAVEMVEANGSSALQISGGQVLAPEVAAIRFRYLDAGVWYEVWDSETSGRLPRAVEVTIGFPPPRRKPPMFNVPVSHSTDTVRTVILIPVSDPFPKERLP